MTDATDPVLLHNMSIMYGCDIDTVQKMINGWQRSEYVRAFREGQQSVTLRVQEY